MYVCIYIYIYIYTYTYTHIHICAHDTCSLAQLHGVVKAMSCELVRNPPTRNSSGPSTALEHLARWMCQ